MFLLHVSKNLQNKNLLPIFIFSVELAIRPHVEINFWISGFFSPPEIQKKLKGKENILVCLIEIVEKILRKVQRRQLSLAEKKKIIQTSFLLSLSVHVSLYVLSWEIDSARNVKVFYAPASQINFQFLSFVVLKYIPLVISQQDRVCLMRLILLCLFPACSDLGFCLFSGLCLQFSFRKKLGVTRLDLFHKLFSHVDVFIGQVVET